MSIFKFKHFDILQKDSAMKVGTDSMILGSFIDSLNKTKGLDIGSGTGVLSLMIAQKNDIIDIIGVEVDDLAVIESIENFKTATTVSVLGLYPNKLNKVEVTLDFDGGQQVDIIEIQTQELPDYFPSVKVDKLEKESMEPGMHALDIHFANFGKFRSAPIIFDDQGNIRWYLDFSFHGAMLGPFQKIKNGNILVTGRRTIYEFDMMGKQIDKTLIDNNYETLSKLAECKNESHHKWLRLRSATGNDEDE